MAITEIGEETRAFLGAPPRLLVVMIGDIADHLQRMLVERQQPILLRRHSAAGNRVGVKHTSHFRPKSVVFGAGADVEQQATHEVMVDAHRRPTQDSWPRWHRSRACLY